MEGSRRDIPDAAISVVCVCAPSFGETCRSLIGNYSKGACCSITRVLHHTYGSHAGGFIQGIAIKETRRPRFDTTPTPPTGTNNITSTITVHIHIHIHSNDAMSAADVVFL